MTSPPPGAPPFAICYSAFGRAYARRAAVSAWSAKRHMPGVPILLHTDTQLRCPWFDEITLVPTPPPFTPPFTPDPQHMAKAAKLTKIAAILAAPHDRVLYVDCDTYFTDSVADVWSHMGEAGIAAAFDTWQVTEVYRRYNDGLPERAPPAACPFFNGGVLFFRKSEAVLALLHDWHAAYRSNGRIVLEQLLFRELAYARPVGLHVLPPTYNARVGEVLHLSGRIKVAHAICGDDWRTSLPFLADFLNSVPTNRIFCPYDGTMVAMDLSFARLDRALQDHHTHSEQECYLHPDLVFP